MADNEEKRKRAVEYVQRWIGTGFCKDMECSDGTKFSCSGIVEEALKGCGLHHRNEPFYKLLGLYKKYKEKKSSPGPGCLVFWFIQKDGKEKLEHVDIMINEEYLIGTCMGCETTMTAVKMNHISYQGKLRREIVDPFS